ncbi:MAG: S8 family serine peptidase, partial [Chloroflexi bacterium]|nr:S8 family serine peptidase [Chloroflexota bacterium]
MNARGLLLLPLIAAASAFLVLSLVSGSAVTESATRENGLRQLSGRPLKDPKLSSHLVALADASLAGLPKSVSGARAAGALRLTPAGEVQVYIAVNDLAEIDALATLGVSIERVSEELGIVQAWVPVDALRELSGLPIVQSVRLPDYPHLNAGSIETEGDAVLKSDELRTALGVDGTGVTIGVISDGVAGLAASQGLGDLPAVDTSTCNVVPQSPASSGAGAEGTAMLEIVHDIAPGASLMFGHFGFGFTGTVLDFNDAVDCLAANADIVVDDIGWFISGPYDGSSFVSQNTADALNGPGPILGYYTAVANLAQAHYQDPYVESSTVLMGSDIDPLLPPDDTWVLHEFDATGGTKGTKHAGLVGPPADGNRLILPPGGSLSIFLAWDDPWGSSLNDYDLFIGDGSGINVCGGNFQGPGPNSFPAEACFWVNTGPTDLELDIIIGNFLGEAAPVEFDMFLLCRSCSDLGNGNLLDFNTAGSSVPNQSDAGGSPASVISLGAVRHGTPNDIEPFSSHGLTEDGRLKPDIVAPDGVCVTGSGGFGQPSCQGSGNRFFGTSAAAPHAAAVAALLLECDPGLSRTGLYDRMVLTAIDLGAP